MKLSLWIGLGQCLHSVFVPDVVLLEEDQIYFQLGHYIGLY